MAPFKRPSGERKFIYFIIKLIVNNIALDLIINTLIIIVPLQHYNVISIMKLLKTNLKETLRKNEI